MIKMNKKQEEFILNCLTKALSVYMPQKRDEIEAYVFNTFDKLGDE